ncbi:hypothetical protein C1646_821996 [Rhizophagus diaphanus]|nr:hypothetical protein C1646_821996 [Rhizophagus diaphanus] [Rhizophagus sp. MUCL 43196]
MSFHRSHPRQRRTCEEYKAELEEKNYHLHSELQIEVDTNRQNERRINQLERDYTRCEQEIQDLNKEIEHLENASKEEIVELKSEISTLKSQLYQARNDVRDKGKYISSLEKQLVESEEQVKKLRCRIRSISSRKNSPERGNSPDLYNSDDNMATITELANAIDGYVDNRATTRDILIDQIKRATRQIRRKENNLHQDLVRKQRRRYDAEAEQKSSIPESERPSLVNLRNLGYNILKSLEDKTVRDIDFPELGSCSECGNDILMSPLKAFSYLTCGHIFHRLCIEKKLFLGTPSACPAPDCGKSVDILDKAGIISNPDPRVTSQSSGISPLSNSMGTFTLSSPPIRMLGIKGPVTQQDKSPSKPLVYLTCKHIVHYNCIDNPQKLCPICPSTDMEIDDLETPTEQSSSTAQKKRFSEFASEKDSNKKAKQTRKQIDQNDSPILKKLIMELTSPESLEDGLSQDPLITLQSSVSEMDVNLLDFLDLYNKIGTAEDNLRRTTHDLLRCYYIFGQATKQLFNHFRKTCNEDVSNAKVNDRIMNQISVQDKLYTETNL